MGVHVEWPPGIRISREEFLALDDEGHIWEYADGYAQDNLCGGIKGEISATLGYLIARVGRPLGLVTAGRCGWWMVNGNLRIPNVTYTRRDRFPDGRIPDGLPEFAPDLAVEI